MKPVRMRSRKRNDAEFSLYRQGVETSKKEARLRKEARKAKRALQE